MLKKILITTSIIFTALSMPANLSANQYGQEVLGEEAPEEVIVHKPIPTGLEDHPELIGATLLFASAAFYFISKKLKSSQNIF